MTLYLLMNMGFAGGDASAVDTGSDRRGPRNRGRSLARVWWLALLLSHWL